MATKSKVAAFRPKTSSDSRPHVIEWRRTPQHEWRPLPKLMYGSKKSAQAGLKRLLAHKPEYAAILRVGPWRPDPAPGRHLLAA